MHFRGILYRALNPIYAREPLSGRGASLYGGRFNSRGTAALYTALLPETAIKESNQVGSLQPTTLVSFEADIERVFDAMAEDALASYDMTRVMLSSDRWRDQMKQNGRASTQLFAEQLILHGYAGLLVPSFVRGATPNDVNLVLWAWGDAPPARLTLIDDENRLAQIRDE